MHNSPHNTVVKCSLSHWFMLMSKKKCSWKKNVKKNSLSIVRYRGKKSSGDSLARLSSPSHGRSHVTNLKVGDNCWQRIITRLTPMIHTDTKISGTVEVISKNIEWFYRELIYGLLHPAKVTRYFHNKNFFYFFITNR